MNTTTQKCKDSKAKVLKCIAQYDFARLKNIIALKAPQDSGKTTILKMVMHKLYERDPKSWIGRCTSRGNQFDINRVTNYAAANRVTAEYSGVFRCHDVVVAISTVGDFTQYIVGNFELFAKAKAVIGVMAVREGNIAEFAYGLFKEKLKFKEEGIEIPDNKYNDARWTTAEADAAEDIVMKIDRLVTEHKKAR